MSIFKPFVSRESIDLVEKTLKSGFINEGKNVIKFEKLISSVLEIKKPLTLNSCTSALHLALILSGIKKNDEVILPAQTFVASATSVLMCGAKPIFADINLDDGNISLESIKKKITNKTKAIIAVHWAGYPCDLTEINNLAKKHNITVIEDAAHALGAKYKGKIIGNISDYTCFSFQSIKHLTTGDGGLISLKRNFDFNKCKRIRWFGIDRQKTKFNKLNVRNSEIFELGYKYHMNDIAAAIGIGNLMNFKKNQKKRVRLANLYHENLKNITGLTQLKYKKNRQSAWWMYNFKVEKRDKFIKMLQKNNIEYSAVNTRIDLNPLFKTSRAFLNNQNQFDKTQLSLSTDPNKSIKDAEKAINVIKRGWV